MTQRPASRVGIVTIGRNEGERLKRCLHSVVGRADRVVYVDSGSTDGSVELARSLGVDVVELDMTRPFTMARGRNAGFERLASMEPPLDYVQFIDGDCEVVDGWIEAAQQLLDERGEVVAVTGRRRERFPDATIYNRMMDMEWNRPPGEVDATGGDVMIRCDALKATGGFNLTMIAGEEPELCFRLRQNGGRIIRLAREMTLHDAAMTRFGQWWKRATRAGHAYADGASQHGRSAERYNVRPVLSSLVWGLFVPLSILTMVVLAIVISPWWWIGPAILALGYARLFVRVARRTKAAGYGPRDARLIGVFTLLAKPAQTLGILRFAMNRVLRRQSTLIEYKGPGDGDRVGTSVSQTR